MHMSAQAGKATTHFGFQEVDETEKEGLVGGVFHRVADKYDVMNDAMSGTMHRLWKDEFVAMMDPIVNRSKCPQWLRASLWPRPQPCSNPSSLYLSHLNRWENNSAGCGRWHR